MAVCREILEGQQGEMDFLVSQQRDTKRDSRLVSGVGELGGWGGGVQPSLRWIPFPFLSVSRPSFMIWKR